MVKRGKERGEGVKGGGSDMVGECVGAYASENESECRGAYVNGSDMAGECVGERM